MEGSHLAFPIFTIIFNFFPAVYNFSHRIDHLSFGNDVPGHINPLDGTEKIAFERRSFSYDVCK